MVCSYQINLCNFPASIVLTGCLQGADIDIRVVRDGRGPNCNVWTNFEQVLVVHFKFLICGSICVIVSVLFSLRKKESLQTLLVPL